MPVRRCFCGGNYSSSPTGGRKSECERVDCPRARLGYGSWHKALPKLQEMDRMGQLRVKYPDINFIILEDHVSRMGERQQGMKDFSRRLAAIGDREHHVGAGHGPTKRERDESTPEVPQKRARGAASSFAGINPAKRKTYVEGSLASALLEDDLFGPPCEGAPAHESSALINPQDSEASADAGEADSSDYSDEDENLEELSSASTRADDEGASRGVRG